MDTFPAMTVDRFDPTPLYQQIAALIREQIRSGQLEPLQVLPSEAQLAQAHEVARETVRQAMRLLREEGWIITIQARGSYAAPPDRWPAG